MRKKAKGVTIRVHPNFYDKVEEARQKFMKKNKLDKLTTVAFTGVLTNKKWIGGKKNVKKQKSRRK